MRLLVCYISNRLYNRSRDVLALRNIPDINYEKPIVTGNQTQVGHWLDLLALILATVTGYHLCSTSHLSSAIYYRILQWNLHGHHYNTLSLLWGSKNVLKGYPLACLEWTTVPHAQRTWFQNSILSDANEYTLTTHWATTPPTIPYTCCTAVTDCLSHNPAVIQCVQHFLVSDDTYWVAVGCATEYHLCKT